MTIAEGRIERLRFVPLIDPNTIGDKTRERGKDHECEKRSMIARSPAEGIKE